MLVFFLPVFFTFTGLRTNVLGLDTAADLPWLALVLRGGDPRQDPPGVLARRA